MPFHILRPAQHVKANRAVERLETVAGGHLDPTELSSLKAHAEEDAGRLAIGGETLVLISTGIGLVSVGLGLLVKRQAWDIWLPMTLFFLVSGVVGCWWSHSRMAGVPKIEHTHVQKVILLLSVILLGSFVGVVQTYYKWPSVTSLLLCGTFLFLAARTEQPAVLVAALSALAAFIGVQKLPNNWTVFEIASDPHRSWTFVGVILLLATVLRYWKQRPLFALICLDIAIPVGLFAECSALIDSVDENQVAPAITRAILLTVVALGIIAASRHMRIRFLSVISVSAIVVALLAIVRLFLSFSHIATDNQDILFVLFMAICSLVAVIIATRLVKTAPRKKVRQ